MGDLSSRQRILIVDDEPINIKLLASELKSTYDVVFALKGEDAIKIAGGAQSVDLILLDIMMPGANGYEVCERLKAFPHTQNIPVIFITTMSLEEDETKGLEIGAVDYITKPFSMAIVKARIKTHLELKQHRDRLERLSTMDGLTGIANRRRFDERLEREWKLACRDAVLISLILIDIDNFKLYNDNYGHIAGDDCLRKVAQALNDSVRRPADMVARYGGEEFAAILPKTDREGAMGIAEIMRTRVEALQIPHEKSEVAAHITVSLGVVTALPSPHEFASYLVNAGDKALYEAKHNGRNRVICYDDTHYSPVRLMPVTPDG
jgi:diguanylate cyclase (GGDEF)-like protein